MSVSPEELPVWKGCRCSDGVLPGVFCRAWIDSVEGYNGLVAGMSHAEENNGWEGPALLDRGEGQKDMFKLSPRSASKLPGGSIPPADLHWPNSASSKLPVCKLMPTCRFGQALQVNECGEAGACASFWSKFKCSSSFSQLGGVQPACPGPLLHVLIAGAAGRHIHIRQVGSLQAAGNGSQATAVLAGKMGAAWGWGHEVLLDAC